MENAKILNPPSDVPRIDMREFGFRGFVSDQAATEIEANDARARRVLTTADKFIFR